jgi:hypothetical protein
MALAWADEITVVGLGWLAIMQRIMQTVLDLDLDFFVWPIEHMPEDTGRLPETEYKHSPPDEVREFLEARCTLKRGKKIPGHEMVEHDEAFSTWRRWLRAGVLSAPFNVIHVDAHADLGLGDSGWVYLLSELLALPWSQRSEPRFEPRALNSGNYLAFAIANRWIGNLTYVFPYRKPPERQDQVSIKVFEGEKFVRTLSLGTAVSEQPDPRPTDLMHLLFRDRNARTGLIELRHLSPDTVTEEVWNLNPPVPIHVEPAVPFNYIASDRFKFEGFTHMTVAQSPQFTPSSADKLLPIFRD